MTTNMISEGTPLSSVDMARVRAQDTIEQCWNLRPQGDELEAVNEMVVRLTDTCNDLKCVYRDIRDDFDEVQGYLNKGMLDQARAVVAKIYAAQRRESSYHCN